MAKLMKCKNCDEIYEIIWQAGCEEGACHECACGEMEEPEIKSADWKTEKHVPVVEKVDGGIKVVVGSTLHPMVAEHWITMIQIEVGNKQYRQFLKPGDKPEAIFPIDANVADVKALEHCNIHGLWKNK